MQPQVGALHPLSCYINGLIPLNIAWHLTISPFKPCLGLHGSRCHDGWNQSVGLVPTQLSPISSAVCEAPALYSANVSLYSWVCRIVAIELLFEHSTRIRWTFGEHSVWTFPQFRGRPKHSAIFMNIARIEPNRADYSGFGPLDKFSTRPCRVVLSRYRILCVDRK